MDKMDFFGQIIDTILGINRELVGVIGESIFRAA
jgi:hypothetical protein